jgi:hypothetical protein
MSVIMAKSVTSAGSAESSEMPEDIIECTEVVDKVVKC